VVVKVNGVEKTLQLRKGSGPLNAPTPVQPLPTGFNVANVNAGAPATPGGPMPMMLPATPVAAAAAPVAPPTPKPEAPATPESQAKAETEARMLVSDLLEIGMAQRKAYEEAQRRAAEGNAQPATTQNPSATTPTAGTQPQPEKPNGN
jgi:hypothetical protein